jgi:murein DD-endopeptidase MepM/ murein hydrolase activator NlpD
MSKWITVFLALISIAACRPSSVVTPFAATLPASSTTSVLQSVTSVPTANPVASRTPTLPPTVTLTPSLTPTITPSPTLTLTPTNTLSPTPVPTSTPIASATRASATADPNYTPPPTWTPPPADPAVQVNDHYRLRRPIDDSGVNYIARTYPYGGTSGGQLQVHLGVDMENPRGTPILAAADGVVVYAGDDTGTQFGPSTTYYGNLIVIQHGFNSPEGEAVYTLYGHMHRVDVETGQTVSQGDQIGIVGDSGVAFGPHLHFEVRVGNYTSYTSTRNPELWIYPYQTFGTLAGRVTDANGTPLYDATLQVQSTDITRYAFSYADSTVNPDPTFDENFVLGDLPANYYEVTVRDNGRLRFQKIVFVYPNRTTWVDVQLRP